jgi:hypothetical protein
MTERERFREAVRSTLMSSRCQKIALQFGSHRITGLDYSFIALAMLQPVDAVVGIDDRNDLKIRGSGAFQQRDGGQGASFVSPAHPLFANTIHEQIVIVHESTHAVFAAWKGTTIRRLANEAVAYIADSCLPPTASRNGPWDEATAKSATMRFPKSK